MSDAIIGAAIGAGGQIVQSGTNFLSDLFFNKQRQRLQQQIFKREDTAVQRKVADLQAAGLSPVLAAGQGAQSGAVVSMNAPKWEGANPAEAGMSAFAKAKAAEAIDSENEVRLQMTRKAAADATRAELENDILRQTMGSDIMAKNASADVVVKSAADKIKMQSEELLGRQLENAKDSVEIRIKESDLDSAQYKTTILKLESEIKARYGMSEQAAKVLSMELANAVTKYNTKWFTDMKLPISSSADVWSKMIGVLTQIGNEQVNKGKGTENNVIDNWLRRILGINLKE